MPEIVEVKNAEGEYIEVLKYTHAEYYDGIDDDNAEVSGILVKPLHILNIEPWYFYSESRSPEFLKRFGIDPTDRRSLVDGPETVYRELWALRVKAKEQVKRFLDMQDLGEGRDKDFVLTHYRNCRRLSIYDQAMDLFEQGLVEYKCAWEDDIFIHQGYYRYVAPPVAEVRS